MAFQYEGWFEGDILSSFSFLEHLLDPCAPLSREWVLVCFGLTNELVSLSVLILLSCVDAGCCWSVSLMLRALFEYVDCCLALFHGSFLEICLKHLLVPLFGFSSSKSLARGAGRFLLPTSPCLSISL